MASDLVNAMSGNSHSDDRSDPCIMVIFGASGDLTKRKLIPALYNLAKAGLLSRQFAVIGIARSEMSDEQFREKISQDMKEFATSEIEPDLWDWVQRRLHYIPGEFGDDNLYQRLKGRLEEVNQEHGTHSNYFYYLATAPSFFGEVARRLNTAGLAHEEPGKGWRRVIVEKPFGRDFDSAHALNLELKEVFNEKQIYRIDHYLGKETVQNILVFRFGNGIFEPIWNRRYIDHVQITASEAVGVEGRGGYYETSGALRDMVPNHLFQLVTLTAMEPPISFEADAVRDEQAKILHAIQPMTDEEVIRRTVRGQYGDGLVKGERAVSYRAETNVAPNSNTETFVAMKLLIDNWRWADVPFYLRTGKHLPKRVTEIAIQFKRAPFVLFRDTPVDKLVTNRLVIHIQPDEGISLHFGAKVPGPVVKLGDVDMDFNYVDYFGKTTSTGYERLLYDCMTGDATLFQRADMVEAAWRVVSPIIDLWSALPARNFPNYASGTWGPKEADDLLEREGRRWRKDEEDFAG
ncbi:MAG: glucose-6-phosphate dehydrogenase [Acidobacteriota bacterium]